MTDEEVFNACLEHGLEPCHIGKRSMTVKYSGYFGEYTFHLNPGDFDSPSTFVKLLFVSIERAAREAGEISLKQQFRNLLDI